MLCRLGKGSDWQVLRCKCGPVSDWRLSKCGECAFSGRTFSTPRSSRQTDSEGKSFALSRRKSGRSCACVFFLSTTFMRFFPPSSGVLKKGPFFRDRSLRLAFQACQDAFTAKLWRPSSPRPGDKVQTVFSSSRVFARKLAFFQGNAFHPLPTQRMPLAPLHWRNISHISITMSLAPDRAPDWFYSPRLMKLSFPLFRV